VLRVGQKLGKYQIEQRLADGSFANVYRATDTIEGIRVALKIPHAYLMNQEVLEDFRTEVRLMAQLDHANILSLKDANFIDSHFVLAFPLGERSLADRIQSRMSLNTVLDYIGQMLEAVAYAHSNRVIHCDIKPENFILFGDNKLLLTDFGISKVARRTVQASGSGTVGYVAPEQAVGKPSFRSDVFSLGLVMYRMFSGRLPEWPYEWPPPGFERLRGRLHPDLIELLRKAIQLNPFRRFKDVEQMQAAFRRIRPRAVKYWNARKQRKMRRTTKRDWQTVRRQQFQQSYGKLLETRFACHRCQGPVSEAMQTCPWCGAPRSRHRHKTRFPAQCPRCGRGMKLDWTYCPWCYGPGFEPTTNRQYSDVRYQGRCSNPGCSRKLLMPFMRYCPWCRRKVRRKWKVASSLETCASCGWGVYRSFWEYCPWCGKALGSR
jgi:tRNA A-37 threonylcarbamoyl transferase component Bud32